MRTTRPLVPVGAFLCPLLAIIAAAQSQSPNPGATSPSAAQQTASSTPSPAQPAVQVKTRLVTVDVVAQDSHGNVIRGLTADDFEVSDGGRQKIARFAFIDKSPDGGPPKAAAPAPARGIYSNQVAIDRLSMPPTVVLVDSLNSDMANIASTRRDMVTLLKTLPRDTPIAVFLLGHSLRVVQDFTTDPELLRTAVNKAIAPTSVIQARPADDPNSMSLAAFDANGGEDNDDIQQLEDFEKEEYAESMDMRVNDTVDALAAIAHYLSGYPGRKNLVWVSESFPLDILPDATMGTAANTFQSARNYLPQAERASEALENAQVAVYPVDARGLQPPQVMTAAQNVVTRPNSRSRSVPQALSREEVARMQSQQAMEDFAESSGGKTCKNTNDLSGCVETALKDSSSYYELAYEPQNVQWNGNFRKISVKAARSGVKLSYRRGYFATDADALAAKQTPEQRLQQACRDYLPSTAIAISAQAAPSKNPGQLDFQLVIPPGGVAIISDGASKRMNARLATCAYGPKGNTFAFSEQDLGGTLSDSAYAQLQSRGELAQLSVGTTNINRVRVAVLDLTSGETGALDIPIDSKLAAAPAPPPPAPAHLGFHDAVGHSGGLDWSGDALVYQGDLAIQQTAPAFFSSVFAKDFHCDAGALVPRDEAAPDPSLRLTFVNDAAGKSAIVDLKGGQPEYSGTLPIDGTAKPFFVRLWYLVHCQAPRQ